MTIFHKTVKLSGVDPTKYCPPIGIDIIWQPKDIYNNTVIATFIASDINSRPEETRFKEDINTELSKLKVIQDRVRDYTTYRELPTWHKKVYANLNNSCFDRELDYLRDKKQTEKGLIDSG
jgi:hypothetical protein